MLTIGIDIGGTKIRSILWDGKRVFRVQEFLTPGNETDFKKRVLELITLLDQRGAVRRIGIGAAGIVEKSTLLFSPNIPYIKNLNFRSLFPRAQRLRLDNDARCFARAEFLLGPARNCRSVFALTIGTGIGRAYGRQGKIINLKKFEYPERWEKRYQAIRNLPDNTELAEFLGEKLSALISPFKPEAILIGGGVLERQGFFPMLRMGLLARGLTRKIYRDRLRKDAVAIGAALLFKNLT